MEKGKFILRGFSLHLNIDEVELSLHDLDDFAQGISDKVVQTFCEEVKRKINSRSEKLFYSGTLQQITEQDTVYVLPSENCVTNTDKLKYDERIDGITARVVNVFPPENKVSIRIEKFQGTAILRLGQTVVVHGHWLKKIEE